jgi:hypothetical protein
VRSMDTVETVMETDGDGSGGTSLSRQAAETETSVPRNSSVAMVVLRNCYGKNADRFSVPRLLIGERSSSGVDQGVSPWVGTASGWATPPHGKATL